MDPDGRLEKEAVSLTDPKTVFHTLSNNPRANSTYEERNQIKTERTLYFERTDYGNHNAEFSTGLASVSFKMKFKFFLVNLNVDVLNFSISSINSKTKGNSRTHFGIVLNGVNVAGDIGFENKKIKVLLGKGVGLATGVEFYSTKDKDRRTYFIDGGIIYNVRVKLEIKE